MTDEEQKLRSVRGRENVARWNAAHHRYVDLETKVATFGASLDEHYGATPAPSVVALKAASTASYAAVLLLERRILRGRGRYCTTQEMFDRLPTLVGALQRVMRALDAADGRSGKPPDDPSTPPGTNATPEQRREWSRRYLDGLVAEREPTQS